MTHRPAKQVLTGHVYPPSQEGDIWQPDIRYGRHERGFPAVTIDIRTGRQTRTYRSVEELRALARDIEAAADWLEEAQAV